jgi:hypothetical protein
VQRGAAIGAKDHVLFSYAASVCYTARPAEAFSAGRRPDDVDAAAARRLREQPERNRPPGRRRINAIALSCNFFYPHTPFTFTHGSSNTWYFLYVLSFIDVFLLIKE